VRSILNKYIIKTVISTKMNPVNRYKYLKQLAVILFIVISIKTVGKCPTVKPSFTTSETAICGPGSKSISFVNTSAGYGSSTADYNWYLNGVSFDKTTGLVSPQNTTITDVGNYAFMLVGIDNGCKDTFIVNVYIYPNPIANFTAPGNSCGDATIIFKNMSSGIGNFSTYSWDFGDGIKSTAMNPTHSYSAVTSYFVSLTVSNGNNCKDTYKDTVTIFPGPVASIEGKDKDGDTNYCLPKTDLTAADTVDFYNQSNNSESFRWDFGDGSPLFTTDSKEKITHIYTSYGTFKVTMIATSKDGCEKSTTLLVVFNKLVETFFSLEASMLSGCIPHSVMPVNKSLNADEYVWNFGDGTATVKTTNSSPFTHLYKKEGRYVISLKASNGCNSLFFNSDSIRVEQRPVSKFTIDPITGCAPQTIEFKNESTITSPVSNYHWDFGDGSVWEGTEKPDSKIYQEGKWKITLVASNRCGSDTSFQTLVINKKPMPPTVKEETICKGNVATMHVIEPKGIYEWFDAASTGKLIATGEQLTTPALTADAIYYVQCKIGNCASERVAVKVHVLPLPESPLVSGVTICNGSTATLNASGPGNYEWYNSISGGIYLDTTRSFTTPALSASTDYYVQVTIGTCKSLRSLVKVTVKDPPKADYQTTTVCLGEPTVFKDLSSGSPTSWFWDFGDGTTASTGPTVMHSYSNAGSFITKLTVSNGVNCNSSWMLKTSVNALIKTDLLMKDSACVFELLALRDNSFSGTDSIAAATWDFGDGSLIATTLHAEHAYTGSGNYTVKHDVISDKGCRSTSTNTVHIASLPTAIFSSKNTCQIQKSIFTDQSTGNPVNWDWDFGDKRNSMEQNPQHDYALSGYYPVKLTIKTALGCMDSTVHKIFVYPQPKAAFTSDTVCWGDTTTFKNTSHAVDGTIDQVLWDFNDGSTSNQFHPKHILKTEKDQFEVTLFIVTSHGCTDTITQTVKTNPLPVFHFFATDKTGCEGFTTTFYDSSTVKDGKIMSWLWDFGDGNVTVRRNPTHTFDKAGKYYITLKVTSSYGCQMHHMLNEPIVVLPKPTAEFIVTPTEMSIDQPTVQFMDASTNAVMWDWDFGDHKTSIDRNPFHTYSDTGRFIITQIVINEFGCNDTTQHTVRVNLQPSLYIPNAFSPGDDKVNDVFLPVGNGISDFSMSIFDRWGKEIFKTDSMDNGWDGRINGSQEMVTEGTYVYKIYLKDALQVNRSYVGSVFVIKR
jgi:gliding motility-associated-like protein